MLRKVSSMSVFYYRCTRPEIEVTADPSEFDDETITLSGVKEEEEEEEALPKGDVAAVQVCGTFYVLLCFVFFTCCDFRKPYFFIE